MIVLVLPFEVVLTSLGSQYKMLTEPSEWSFWHHIFLSIISIEFQLQITSHHFVFSFTSYFVCVELVFEMKYYRMG